MVTVQEIKNEIGVQTILIALALYVGLEYLVNDLLPSGSTILTAIFIMGTVAFLLRNKFNSHSTMGQFLMGTISYLAYSFVLLFFKLTEQTPALIEEGFSAILFGGLCILAYYLLNKIR